MKVLGGFENMVSVLVIGWLLAGVAALLWWVGYGGPKSRAFATHQSTVAVWFGFGTLHLWRPGETFVFLRNKQVRDVGSPEGGLRTVVSLRGEEAFGPISLKTELMTWPDIDVLTREAQPLSVKLAVWWKVARPQEFAFRIASEVHHRPGDRPLEVDRNSGPSGRDGRYVADVHEAAVRWIQVLTESAVRSHVSTLGMADVVSAQAMQFLQIDGGSPRQTSGESGGFESLIGGVRDTVSFKAAEYGIQIKALEVQQVKLPSDMQKAIDETRRAFLAPIRSEREAEARKVALQKLAEVLGPETVGLNELLSNFKGSNFGYIPPFLQGVLGMIDRPTNLVAQKQNGPPAKALPEGNKPSAGSGGKG